MSELACRELARWAGTEQVSIDTLCIIIMNYGAGMCVYHDVPVELERTACESQFFPPTVGPGDRVRCQA